jgi:SNF2 family DNA or RNA helicase
MFSTNNSVVFSDSQVGCFFEINEQHQHKIHSRRISEVCDTSLIEAKKHCASKEEDNTPLLSDDELYSLYIDDMTVFLRFALNTKHKDKIFELLKVRGVPFIPSFKSILPHQEKVLRWMKDMEANTKFGITGGILSLEMGLGKTLSALVHTLSSGKGDYPTLVVCSKTVMNVWYDEIDKFFGKNIKVLYFHENFIGKEIKNTSITSLKNYDLVITTYDVCKSVCRKTKINEDCLERGEEWGIHKDKILKINCCNLETLKTRNLGKYGPNILYMTPFERLIFDESQVFANPKTGVYKAMMALYGKYKWCLTGTPIRNFETDVWAQLRVLGYDKEGARTTLEWMRNTNLWEKDKLYERVFRMGYEEAGVKLPPLIRVPNTTLIDELVDDNNKIFLSKEEKEIYLFVLGVARQVFDMMLNKMCSFACVLALFTRLRQCAIAPYLMTDQSKRKKKRKTKVDEQVEEMMSDIQGGPLSKICFDKYGVGGIGSTKMRETLKILKKIKKDDKVLVFSTFTSCLDLLQDAVKHDSELGNYKVLQLDGDIVGNERAMILSQFRNDKSVNALFLTYKVGSEGLNLTCANNCICMEPWWNYAVTDQAEKRAHRTGQTKQVTSHRIYISQTIEERVIDICEGKRKMAASFLDSSSTSMGEIKKNYGLTKEILGNILDMSEYYRTKNTNISEY